MNSLVQIRCQNGNLVKIRGVAPVCEGAGSYFALEQSLVIFVAQCIGNIGNITNLDRIVVCWLCHSH